MTTASKDQNWPKKIPSWTSYRANSVVWSRTPLSKSNKAFSLSPDSVTPLLFASLITYVCIIPHTRQIKPNFQNPNFQRPLRETVHTLGFEKSFRLELGGGRKKKTTTWVERDIIQFSKRITTTSKSDPMKLAHRHARVSANWQLCGMTEQSRTNLGRKIIHIGAAHANKDTEAAHLRCHIGRCHA
jgi:hypothetical protein